MKVIPVAGKVGSIGKRTGANSADRPGWGQVAGAGQGYPADLRGAEGDAEIMVVGSPA